MLLHWSLIDDLEMICNTIEERIVLDSSVKIFLGTLEGKVEKR